jgi:hypothetical protein
LTVGRLGYRRGWCQVKIWIEAEVMLEIHFKVSFMSFAHMLEEGALIS